MARPREACPGSAPVPGQGPLGPDRPLPPGEAAQRQKPQLPGRGSACAAAGFGSPILRPLTSLSHLAPAGQQDVSEHAQSASPSAQTSPGLRG